jgi:predicted N-formylglutamate amidohydrolase
MLGEDIPGGRLLTLRRRRSRLPWLYSVYHATRSNLRVMQPYAGTTSRKPREVRSFTPVLQGDFDFVSDTTPMETCHRRGTG